jgi:hypothetical protein
MRNFPFPWISGAESPSAPLTAPPLRIIIIRRRDRMRIWDLPPERLCRQHLLGEHREGHPDIKTTLKPFAGRES